MKMVDNYPLVSIVVPTFNQAVYLEACLDSIMFQSYPNLEIIVVADPSNDNTFEVLDNYKEKLKKDKVSYVCGCNNERYQIIKKEENRYPQYGRELVIIKNKYRMGHGKSYNLGFKMAKGKFCTYVASDDILLPNMVSTLVDILINEDVDFVYSDMFIVDDNMHILRHFKLPDYSFEKCFCEWYFCGVSKLYKLELHRNFGFFDENYIANDYECYLRFAINGAKFKHIDQVLYLVRTHKNRKRNIHSIKNEKRLLDESILLSKRAIKYLTTIYNDENK